MKNYRKKPVVIQAVQYNGENASEVIKFTGALMEKESFVTGKWVKSLIISTLEGEMSAQVGDYIIKGVQGEFYPCKPDIFKETYEEVL